MTDIYRYDYYALEGVDVARWSEDFFWCVSPEETTAVVLALKRYVFDIVEELGNTHAGDVVLIANNVTSNFARVMVHLANIQRLESRGSDVRFSRWMKLLPMLVDDSLPVAFPKEDIWRDAKEMRGVRRAKNLVLSLKLNAGFKKRNPFRYIASGRSTLALYADNVVHRTYTRHLSDWIRITTPEEWCDDHSPVCISSFDEELYRNVAERLCDFASEYLRDCLGVDMLARRLVLGLNQYVFQTFVSADEAYRTLCGKMQRLRPAVFLLPTGGKPLARALALASRAVGCHSIGFAHGYEICHLASPRMVYQELATPDSFMTYFPGSCELFERIQDMVPPPRGHRTIIEHEDNPILHDTWLRWQIKPRRQRVRKVMILEVSLSHEWAGYHLADSMVTYEFYYRLCKTLTENGYEVVFKRRPKAPSWCGVDILSMPGVSVRYEPFEAEETLEDIDSIILQYGWSSTLKYAVCTNKQVIYVDAGWEPWFPDVYNAMAKRCAVLRCRYDERNRCLFDQEELLSILASGPGPLDTGFMDHYLFPQGVSA